MPTGLHEDTAEVLQRHGMTLDLNSGTSAPTDGAGTSTSADSSWITAAINAGRSQLIYRLPLTQLNALIDVCRSDATQQVLVLGATKAQVCGVGKSLAAALNEPVAILPPERSLSKGDRIACSTVGSAARIFDRRWDVVIALNAAAAVRPQYQNPFHHIRATSLLGFVQSDRPSDELERLRIASVFRRTCIPLDAPPAAPEVVLIVGPAVHGGGARNGRELRESLWSHALRNPLIVDLARAAASGDDRELLRQGIDAAWVGGRPSQCVAVVAEHPEHARKLHGLLKWPLVASGEHSRSDGARRAPFPPAFVTTGPTLLELDRRIDLVINAAATSNIYTAPGFGSQQPAGRLIDVLDAGDERIARATHERLRNYRERGWIADGEKQRVERILAGVQ